ncbi:MAG TPA: DNA polymerase III subunit delta [Clostridiaceae bacterium]|nr:DNA polymerase III subunit delta [Clostridiaceae bacterium]
MSISALKQDIKSKKFRRLYLFYGPEEYLKKHYLQCIEDCLVDDSLKMLNRAVLEGKVDVTEILDNCETMPVFSDRRLVIVKNSGLFKRKDKQEDETKEKSSKDNELIRCLKNIPEYTCLIFYEEDINKNLKAVKFVAENGLLVEFSYQKRDDLIKWVIKHFKLHNKSIDPLLASQLIENCDQGMTEILNEINKVIMYMGDRREATSGDIEAVCSRSIKSRIFDLTDAMAEKNCGKALRALNDMIIMKEPLPLILFMITRQFRQILEMKLHISEGLNLMEAASKMGISNPYVAKKIEKQIKRFSIEELKRAINRCMETDVAIKNGLMNDRIALELLIAEFSR